MKQKFYKEIINALKSREYWFGFSIIVVSCAITAFYNLSPNGVFGDLRIGGCEFFIAASMYGNILLRISAPVIAVFVCMDRNSLFKKDKETIQELWKNKKMKFHLLINVIIGGSVFLFSYILIFIFGIILFSVSTGTMQPEYGLFRQLYQETPAGYILLYILHSFICGALYALFGASIKIITIKPTCLVLFIPLVFYSCAARLGWLFPFLNGVISFVAPLFTFDITVYDISPTRRIAELSAVLIISIILIIISYYRSVKYSKQETKSSSNDSSIIEN